MRTLLLLVATIAAAEPRHEIHVGSHVRALHAASANALTEESLAGPELGYAYRLPLAVADTELWAAGSLALAFVTGQMFQTIETSARALQLTAGLRARRPLWRNIVVATARFEAGAERVGLVLEDAMGHTANDTGWGAVSTAAAGLELGYGRRAWGLSLRFELGYTFTQAVGLDARSRRADDMIALDRASASLGQLDLGGKFFATTITTRF